MHGSMYRVAGFVLSRCDVIIFMLSNVSCRGRVTRSFVGYPSHKTYTCQYCNVSSLILQLTSDIVAILYRRPHCSTSRAALLPTMA